MLHGLHKTSEEESLELIKPKRMLLMVHFMSEELNRNFLL